LNIFDFPMETLLAVVVAFVIIQLAWRGWKSYKKREWDRQSQETYVERRR
jgi:predicted negative regulator of RcsB-dependent stress response